MARVHFAAAKADVDLWKPAVLLRPVNESLADDVWATSQTLDEPPETEKQPTTGAAFAPIPSALSQGKRDGEFERDLKDYLYRQQSLTVWRCAAEKIVSRPDESEKDFRDRLAKAAAGRLDDQTKKIQARYETKLTTLRNKRDKLQQRLEKERRQWFRSMMNAIMAAINLVLTVLASQGKRGRITGTNATMRTAGQAMQQHGDVGPVGSDCGGRRPDCQDRRGP